MHPPLQAIILSLAALAAAVGTHYAHPRSPAWYLVNAPLAEDEVTPADVQTRWQGKVIWIDARSQAAYDAAHIPGALLLNEEKATELLYQHFEKLQDNEFPVVVYCDVAACQASRRMVDYLKERLPIAELYVLRGGWQAWQAQEGSTQK